MMSELNRVAISQIVSTIIAAVIIGAAFSGFVVGAYGNRSSLTPSTITLTTIQNRTVVLIETTTAVSQVTTTVFGNTTVTVQITTETGQLEPETIAVIVFEEIYTLGGGGACYARNASSQCIGGSTEQIEFRNSTSYIIPSGNYFFATVTTITSSSNFLKCGNATSSYTTSTVNSTNGAYQESWTWSQSCS